MISVVMWWILCMFLVLMIRLIFIWFLWWMRWWWIVEIMSSDGIGMRFLFELWLDRMMNFVLFLMV